MKWHLFSDRLHKMFLYKTSFFCTLILFHLLIIPLDLSCKSIQEKKVFAFSEDPIDVIIPCTDKDLETLDLCIQGIRKNGPNIRRVIIISDQKLTEKAEWFDEKN